MEQSHINDKTQFHLHVVTHTLHRVNCLLTWSCTPTTHKQSTVKQ